jgi:hypothetical protein
VQSYPSRPDRAVKRLSASSSERCSPLRHAPSIRAHEVLTAGLARYYATGTGSASRSTRGTGRAGDVVRVAAKWLARPTLERVARSRHRSAPAGVWSSALRYPEAPRATALYSAHCLDS